MFLRTFEIFDFGHVPRLLYHKVQHKTMSKNIHSTASRVNIFCSTSPKFSVEGEIGKIG